MTQTVAAEAGDGRAASTTSVNVTAPPAVDRRAEARRRRQRRRHTTAAETTTTPPRRQHRTPEPQRRDPRTADDREPTRSTRTAMSELAGGDRAAGAQDAASRSAAGSALRESALPHGRDRAPQSQPRFRPSEELNLALADSDRLDRARTATGPHRPRARRTKSSRDPAARRRNLAAMARRSRPHAHARDVSGDVPRTAARAV